MSRISSLPVLFPDGAGQLQGELILPEHAQGIVCAEVQALQSQSELMSSGQFGVLRIELLTAQERGDARVEGLRRNCIELLAQRLARATDWLAYAQSTTDLPIGYLGTGIGSAVALMAAAARPALVSAVVSTSGLPLLAPAALPQVRAPTLLIACNSDLALVKVNRAAVAGMRCEKSLQLIETPETASQLARRWFECYLAPGA